MFDGMTLPEIKRENYGIPEDGKRKFSDLKESPPENLAVLLASHSLSKGTGWNKGKVWDKYDIPGVCRVEVFARGGRSIPRDNYSDFQIGDLEVEFSYVEGENVEGVQAVRELIEGCDLERVD